MSIINCIIFIDISLFYYVLHKLYFMLRGIKYKCVSIVGGAGPGVHGHVTTKNSHGAGGYIPARAGRGKRLCRKILEKGSK